MALTVEINRMVEGLSREGKGLARLFSVRRTRIQEKAGAWRITDIQGVGIDPLSGMEGGWVAGHCNLIRIKCRDGRLPFAACLTKRGGKDIAGENIALPRQNDDIVSNVPLIKKRRQQHGNISRIPGLPKKCASGMLWGTEPRMLFGFWDHRGHNEVVECEQLTGHIMSVAVCDL